MHLLTIRDLSDQQIQDIFGLAARLKKQDPGKILSGKYFVLFFPESSIRTRLTFERAIKDLGGETILFPPDSLDRREKLEDVIQYISNWADGVVVRHSDLSKVEELSWYAPVPVINAMTSDHHPCEILSDLFSISERREDYRELVYTFVGPAGNISRSWMQAAEVLDLDFHQVCLPGYELGKDTRNYTFHTHLDAVLSVSDVVITDALPKELKTNDYIKKYQLTTERMKLAHLRAMLNPCPPFFREEEVSTDAIASEFFVGYEFKKNLLYVQQAILLYGLGIS
ncbi:ornithine carbamoyltransferase [Pullulanibacillus sp. KACC 23026]|uniref:ornithine carbamoyltransferase n=1 Tax=Pullulanibacillus sp. KACC 23026 TaxID=3028315 RepID=UPI0023AFBC1B|nr:ornithine carbamoyltransferase [Pullulanibacillus sp. KACC 23026]WEG14572.1 ornithine carbamoyltransferase [Pullulanibacillus sp. KACC 23026]